MERPAPRDRVRERPHPRGEGEPRASSRATTCIPGPIGPGTSASYHLTWEPATDKVSPSSAIAYEIYQAGKSGGEDFSTPTYTTPPGATSFDTPPLPADQTFYFIVRATDEAGNTDSNTVEREGVNLCV